VGHGVMAWVDPRVSDVRRGSWGHGLGGSKGVGRERWVMGGMA
jgi:hypothetical protein